MKQFLKEKTRTIPMNFSPSDYLDCVKDYVDNWKPLDIWLYALCQTHPAHASAAEVNAKLWIVGRTYKTQIERMVRSSGPPMQGSEMGKGLAKVAKLMLSRGAELDGLFATLRTVHEPLSDTKLRQILDVHGKFVEMLKTVTIQRKAATAFVAKYVHFHNPVAPIYDNLAARKITKIVGRQRLPLGPSGQSHYDPSYIWYLERFWALYSWVASNHPDLPLRVKYIDAYLTQ